MSVDPKWGSLSPFHDPALLAGFRPRPSDVLITTAPKAGTTWMQQILHQLRSGGDESFRSIFDEVPWLEFPRPKQTAPEVLAAYEGMPDPRIFKTHCTFEQTPGIGTVKVVLSSRDPRDCCVSYYHHVLGLTDEVQQELGTQAPATFDEVFERWLNFGAWFRNVRSWWPHRNDEWLLWLRYEDMKRDLPGAVDQILEFLGWRLSAEQKQKVLRYSSFEWMRAHSDRFTTMSGRSQPHFKAGTFIRKGEVGDHQSLLSPDQSLRILQKAREMLEPDCLKFLGLDGG